MATKQKKGNDQIDLLIARAIQYSPFWAPALITVVLIAAMVWPAYSKFSVLCAKITEKENTLTTVARSTADLVRMTSELETFRKKVVEFESKLPSRMKTTLIIETLQEITKKSKLKFSSLEPLPIKKYTIEGTKDVFVELPVKVKLNCGYYDLIDFLKKIETANQLMKIADLNIRDDPSLDWEHIVEFSISAFSKGDSSE